MLRVSKKLFLYSIFLIFSFFLCSCCSSKTSKFGYPSFVDYVENGKKDIKHKDYYLLYAAASWCSDCQRLSPEIKVQFKELQERCKNVAIIYVGAKRDHSNDSILDYMQTYGFDYPYISYENRKASGLLDLFDIEELWIPGVVLIDKYGNVICQSGSDKVEDWNFQIPFDYLYSHT